jgi:hypothetical protein
MFVTLGHKELVGETNQTMKTSDVAHYMDFESHVDTPATMRSLSASSRLRRRARKSSSV